MMTSDKDFSDKLTPIDYNYTTHTIFRHHNVDQKHKNYPDFRKLNAYCIHFNCKILEFEFDVYCWLGIWIDAKFTFNKHMMEKIKSFKKVMSYLYNMCNKYFGADRDSCDAIVHQICLPIICYGLPCYGSGASKQYMKDIDTIIKHAARRSAGGHKKSSLNTCMRDMGWKTIREHELYLGVIMIHRKIKECKTHRFTREIRSVFNNAYELKRSTIYKNMHSILITLAKNEYVTLDELLDYDIDTFKRLVKTFLKAQRDDFWDEQIKMSFYRKLLDSQTNTELYKKGTRMGQTLAFQLISNTCNMLKSTLHRYKWHSTNKCDVCDVLDDATHLVEICTKYTTKREDFNILLKNNIPEIDLSLTFVELSGIFDYSLDEKECIEELFQQFLISCAQNDCNKKYFKMLTTSAQEQSDRLF